MLFLFGGRTEQRTCDFIMVSKYELNDRLIYKLFRLVDGDCVKGVVEGHCFIS